MSKGRVGDELRQVLLCCVDDHPDNDPGAAGPAVLSAWSSFVQHRGPAQLVQTRQSTPELLPHASNRPLSCGRTLAPSVSDPVWSHSPGPALPSRLADGCVMGARIQQSASITARFVYLHSGHNLLFFPYRLSRTPSHGGMRACAFVRVGLVTECAGANASRAALVPHQGQRADDQLITGACEPRPDRLFLKINARRL